MKALAIAAVLSITCLGALGQAQTPDPRTPGQSAPASHSGKSRAGGGRQTDSGTLADALSAAQDQVNIPTQPTASNGPIIKAQSDYNEAYWKYQRDAIEHTRKVYAWQHVSSVIIFYVVIFLVLVGVLFSWLQFKAAAYKAESEKLDASMTGVKITSSTLGVVILVLSMCFFYLYLRYVYPINVNEGTTIVNSAEK